MMINTLNIIYNSSFLFHCVQGHWEVELFLAAVVLFLSRTSGISVFLVLWSINDLVVKLFAIKTVNLRSEKEIIVNV